MGRESDLNQEAFDRLLAWLNSNRALAGEKYEEIRRRLIKIFTCRGCTCPDVLADETINRVARKVQEIAATYTGDRSLYFYGVARNVHLEYVRKRPVPQPPPTPEPRPESEQEYECLERCMRHLSSSNRDLILQYYQEEKQGRIDHRKELAQRLYIGPNALRIQVYRIRVSLQQCVVECLKQATPV
jgi:DNA-directed RNA polymerase specialized sigma24 family protein